DVATGRVDLAGRGRLGVVVLRRTVGRGGGHGVDAGGTRHADGDGAGSGQVAQGGGPHGVVRKGEGQGDADRGIRCVHFPGGDGGDRGELVGLDENVTAGNDHRAGADLRFGGDRRVGDGGDPGDADPSR